MGRLVCESLQLGYHDLGLGDWRLAGRQDLHSTLPDRVLHTPFSTPRFIRAGAIDAYWMFLFHPLARSLDHRVRSFDDVSARAIVGGQIQRTGLVVLFKTTDEFDGRSSKRIDVLVVVSDGKEAELALIIGEDTLTAVVGVVRRQTVAAQEGVRFSQHGGEVAVGETIRASLKARADQSHRQTVTCQHGNCSGVVKLAIERRDVRFVAIAISVI